MEQCENCGRQIGQLETPYLHNDHVVCGDCKERLGASTTRKVGTSPNRKAASGAKAEKTSIAHGEPGGHHLIRGGGSAGAAPPKTGRGPTVENVPSSNTLKMALGFEQARNYILNCFKEVGTIDPAATSDKLIAGSVKIGANKVPLQLFLVPQGDVTTEVSIVANTFAFNAGAKVAALRLVERLTGSRASGFKLKYVMLKRQRMALAACGLAVLAFFLFQFMVGQSPSASDTPPLPSVAPAYSTPDTPAYTPPTAVSEPEMSTHEKAEWVRQNDHDGTFSNLNDDQAAHFYDNLNRATGGN